MRWLIKKLEGKDLPRLQTWLCVLLVAVMLVTSFGTLYKIEVEVPAKMQSGIDTVVSVLNEPEISGGQPVDFSLPDTLELNVMLFIRFASKTDEIIEVYNSMVALTEYADAKSSSDYNRAYREFKSAASDAIDLVTSSEFENAMALAATLVSSYSTGANKGLVRTLMALMAFILPSCLLAALGWAVVDMIINRKDAEKRYLAAANALRRALAAYMFVLAVRMISNEIHISLWLMVGIALCFVGIALEAVFSRATRYTGTGRAYMSIVQRMSIIELGGFAVFYVFMSLSGVIGKHLSVVVADLIKYAVTKKRGDEFLDIFVSIFVGVAVIACLVAVLEAALYSATRLGGIAPRDRESALVSSIFGGVMIMLLLYITSVDSRIALTATELIFMLLSGLGLAVMIGCEIMIPRLRRKKCPRLHESEKFAVLVGLEVIEVEEE